MKKLSSICKVGLLLLTVLSSCQDPNILDSPTEDQDEIVFYNGIRVLRPAGVPTQALQLKSSAEASDFLSAKYKVPFNSRSQARTAIPDETFYDILAVSVAKFVDINKPIYDQITDDQMHRDFPDFKSKKDLKDHSDIVLDYYSRLIMNDFKKSLQKIKGARYPSGGGNAYEQQLSNEEPLRGLNVYNASLDARNWTLELFNNNDSDDWRGNAFKHACWNAQSVRKQLINGFNQWTAYDWARRFATAHEYDTNVSPWQLKTDQSTIMDLHNNLKGRSFIKDNVTNVFGSAVDWPSESKIRNDHFYHVNDSNVIKIGNGSYIVTLTSPTGTPQGLSETNYTTYPYLAALKFD